MYHLSVDASYRCCHGYLTAQRSTPECLWSVIGAWTFTLSLGFIDNKWLTVAELTELCRCVLSQVQCVITFGQFSDCKHWLTSHRVSVAGIAASIQLPLSGKQVPTK